jgi:hypothetical protein
MDRECDALTNKIENFRCAREQQMASLRARLDYLPMTPTISDGTLERIVGTYAQSILWSTYSRLRQNRNGSFKTALFSCHRASAAFNDLMICGDGWKDRGHHA